MEPCDTCFYGSLKDSHIAPCKSCSGYNKYVKDSIYFWNENDKKFTAYGEEPVKEQYDVVSKPKHYMLFEDKGIEIRDVIGKLLEKIDQSNQEWAFDPQDFADYVQAMQYFMRFMEKGGKQDIQKGMWYMNKILDNWPE